jgi:hypothetical protein
MGHRKVERTGWIAAVVVALAGCTPEPPATPPQPTATATATASALGDVEAIYKSFGFASCRAGDNCARTFSIRAGADIGDKGANKVPNPRASLSNPDPLWLPEWSRLPTGDAGAHYAYEALTLAAVHRSYRAECEKAYDGYAKDLTARLDKLEKEVAAANREPNPYDRLGALLKLEPPKPDKSRMHDLAEGADPVRYKWEVAVFEAFEDTKRTFLYAFDGYPPSDTLLGVIHPRLPKDQELDAFCLAAATGKVAGVPALPDTSSWDAGVRAMVRRFVPEERASALERRRGELADVVKAKFAKVKVPNPQLPPGVREMTLGKIESFRSRRQEGDRDEPRQARGQGRRQARKIGRHGDGGVRGLAERRGARAGRRGDVLRGGDQREGAHHQEHPGGRAQEPHVPARAEARHQDRGEGQDDGLLQVREFLIPRVRSRGTLRISRALGA